ncbi:MAG: hypothetical protein ACQESP_08560 [Candidatus Muiribacteriota bacterium]
MRISGKNLLLIILFSCFINASSSNSDYWLLRNRVTEVEDFISENENTPMPELRRLRYYFLKSKNYSSKGNNFKRDLYFEKTLMLKEKAEHKLEVIKKEKAKVVKLYEQYSYLLMENREYLSHKGKFDDFLKKYDEIKELLNDDYIIKAGSETEKILEKIRAVIGK